MARHRGPVLLLGAGKAACEMAGAFVKHRNLSDVSGTLIVPRRRSCLVLPGSVHAVEGSHPYPTLKSVRATRALLQRLEQNVANHPVVFFLSGGASALLEKPASSITLRQLRETVLLLYRCGADIQEMNVVRKHLSLVKGGRLALAMGEAKCTTYVLSDVKEDRPDVIGSGPTYPDSSTYGEALDILRKFKLMKKIPEPVMRFLAEGAKGKHPETPKRGDPVFKNHDWRLIGNAGKAREGAAKKGEEIGLPVRVLPEFLKGEASALGLRLAKLAKSMKPGSLLVGSGEPTVTVTGRGKGGRCQEAALSFAAAARGSREMHLLAAGTDGLDGPTDAAGAFASNLTVEKGRRLGMDPQRFLKDNDSYSFFSRLGDLILTGPTGTNVNDLFLLWVP